MTTKTITYAEIFEEAPRDFALRSVLRSLICATRPIIDRMEHATYSFYDTPFADLVKMATELDNIALDIKTQLSTIETLSDLRELFPPKPRKTEEPAEEELPI